jgi:uncharacterized protein (TIGR02444 family)
LRLWDYALAVWRRPGVEAASLALQDDHGQCIPLVLWRAWAAAEGRLIVDLGEAIDAARAWEADVVAPLRGVRRRLKGEPVLRETVRAAELAAERHLLERLEALTPPSTGQCEDLPGVLSGLAFAWNAARPAEALDVLADRIG